MVVVRAVHSAILCGAASIESWQNGNDVRSRTGVRHDGQKVIRDLDDPAVLSPRVPSVHEKLLFHDSVVQADPVLPKVLEREGLEPLRLHGHDGRRHDLRVRMNEARPRSRSVILEENRVLDGAPAVAAGPSSFREVNLVAMGPTPVSERRQQIPGVFVVGRRGEMRVMVRTLDDDLVKADGGNFVVQEHMVREGLVNATAVAVKGIARRQRTDGRELIGHHSQRRLPHGQKSLGRQVLVPRTKWTVGDVGWNASEPRLQRSCGRGRGGLVWTVRSSGREHDPRSGYLVQSQHASGSPGVIVSCG